MKNQYTDKALLTPRPKIHAGNLDLPSVSQAAWRALLATNNPPSFFRYGDYIARVNFDVNGGPVVCLLDQHRMRAVLGRVAYWYKLTMAGEKPSLPPLPVVQDILANPDIPLPVLSRIVETPVFASNGDLHLTAGYNDASRCYYAPNGLKIRAVPQQPSPIEISQALELLNQDLLGDFPFISDAERALNDNVFPLHVSKLAQTLPECLVAGRVSGKGGTS